MCFLLAVLRCISRLEREGSVLFSLKTTVQSMDFPQRCLRGLRAVVVVVTVDVKGENRGSLHPSSHCPAQPNLFYIVCFCVRFPLGKKKVVKIF